MTTKNRSNAGFNAFMSIAILASSFFLFSSFITIISKNSLENKTKECASQNMVYDSGTKKCREKTVSEEFTAQCTSGASVGNVSYTCDQLKREGLEEAFLANALVAHGSKLYEKGTGKDIAAGKQIGDYCLSASDTWNYTGHTKCVVFSYTYLACSNGYCFLDEKKDYDNGFVAFFGKYNMYSWNNFRNTYQGKSPILVCGYIYTYNGHPEIKITDASKQVVLSPQGFWVDGQTIYNNVCK